MRVYLDTNIVMEYLGNRTFHKEVATILKAAQQKALDAFISVNSLDTIIYLLGNQLKDKGIHEPEKRQTIRSILCDLLAYIDVVSSSKDDILRALKDTDFSDLEDSVQYHCALENSIDSFITLNTKDFNRAATGIEIITPLDFVNKHIQRQH